jgi:outer membrane protein
MRLNTLTIPTLTAALVLMAPTAKLAAQAKIGVVDFQQSLLQTAEMQKKAAELEAKYKPQQDELDRLAKELQDLQTKIQSATPDEAARLQNEGARKQREAQRLSEDLQADVDFERQAILQSGAERMRAVIEKLRSERTLDLVVEVASAVAFSSAIDMTAAATAAYDTAHPVQ